MLAYMHICVCISYLLHDDLSYSVNSLHDYTHRYKHKYIISFSEPVTYDDILTESWRITLFFFFVVEISIYVSSAYISVPGY